MTPAPSVSACSPTTRHSCAVSSPVRPPTAGLSPCTKRNSPTPYAAAVKEATCAQAADTVLEAKAAAASGGSFTIGKISVTRPATAAVAQPRPGVFYSAQAWRILQRAGLLGHAPWTC